LKKKKGSEMAHQQQRDFCHSVKKKFPNFFIEKLVLDIGSLDINGNNQYLFENSGYIGIDLLPGKNVDFCCSGHQLNLPDASFDVVISTECFEHDPNYSETIKNMYRMLKPGGLFIFSCATTGRPEHGTRRSTPEDAPLIQGLGEWADYYKNLTQNDIEDIFDITENFESYDFSVQSETFDLYFWGVKKGEYIQRSDYSFVLRAEEYVKINEKLKSLSDQLSDQVNILQKKSNLNEDELRKLTEDVVELKFKSEGLQKIIEDVRSEVLANEIFINKILNSRSWKFTAPLRWISKYTDKIFLG
jgi:SAM-dependent methyltransferase